MPLIIITGFPCSGKTYRTQQLAADLASHISTDPASSKRKVQVITSHHASLDAPYDPTSPSSSSLRDQIYSIGAQEKTARAEEFSAIKRAVSKDCVVIADGLSYIKGYRYQLWCEAKAAGTRCCVVHVAAQEDECQRWNNERLKAWERGTETEGQENGQQLETRCTSKQGQDVRGDLIPESHTALYGDRVVANVSRPRSSSMAGGSEDDEAANAQRHDDSMTLKSLYIRDGPEAESRRPESTWKGDVEQPTPSLRVSSPSSSPPPSPSSTPPYSPSTLTSLLMRYEPPSPFARWDTPLFTVPSSDPDPPSAAIYAALFPPPPRPTSKKGLSQPQPPTEQSRSGSSSTSIVKPHAATVLPRATTADALQTLESATLDVVRALLAAARERGLDSSGEGGDISFSVPLPLPLPLHFPASPSPAGAVGRVEVELRLPRGTPLSQPMLQRLRRKYTALQRGGLAHGQGSVEGGRRGVVERFVRFLGAEWEGGDD